MWLGRIRELSCAHYFTAEGAEEAEECSAATLKNHDINTRSGEIVDAAIRVHTALGPGLLESAYEACLAHELRLRGCQVMAQVPLPVSYRGVEIELGYRIDLLVDNAVVVELKAVSKMLPIYEAQLLSYLKLSEHRVGLLINFHVAHLRDGIKRLVNNL